MIGIDFSKMDQSVLTYASYVSELLGVQKVYFTHITPKIALDDDFLKEYDLPNLSNDEKIIEKMKDIVEYNFSYKGAEIDFSVHEGNITEEFLHWINIKEIDLIFVGRKKTMGGSGLIPSRIARHSNASILFVPENANNTIENIVVPIDYSEYSRNALDFAINLNSKNNNKSKITCENVYHVPLGFYKTGKSYEEFAQIMLKNTEKDYLQFVKEQKDLFSVHYSLDDDTSPADKIYEFADSSKADLIIMGGKGRTFTSSVLIGSVAEKLIGYDADIPLLILKKKQEQWGLWDALKNL